MRPVGWVLTHCHGRIYEEGGLWGQSPQGRCEVPAQSLEQSSHEGSKARGGGKTGDRPYLGTRPESRAPPMPGVRGPPDAGRVNLCGFKAPRPWCPSPQPWTPIQGSPAWRCFQNAGGGRASACPRESASPRLL